MHAEAQALLEKFYGSSLLAKSVWLSLGLGLAEKKTRDKNGIKMGCKLELTINGDKGV